MKKVIAWSTALILTVFLFYTYAFAVTGNPAFQVETVQAKAGDTVTVQISALNNPGIASVKFLMEYDTQKLELTKIVYNNNWGGMFQQPQTMNSPVTLTWFDGTGDYTVKDSVFATLTFAVLEGVSGDADITLTYDPEDVYNITETNVYFDVENGKVQVGEPEHTHTVVTDPSVDPTCTEPGLSEGKHCSVCNETLEKQKVIPALGHSFTEGKCVRCGAVEGTGVTRGDADGNGEVNYLDAMEALRCAVGLTTLDETAYAACDVDNDNTVTYLDAMMILRFAVGLEKEFP